MSSKNLVARIQLSVTSFTNPTVHLRAHGGTSDAMVEGAECASELVACKDAGELPPYKEHDAPAALQ